MLWGTHLVMPPISPIMLLAQKIQLDKHEDQKKNLWVGTSRGLSCLQDGKFINYTTGNGLAGNIVMALCEDHEGNIWIGTGAGLDSLLAARRAAQVIGVDFSPQMLKRASAAAAEAGTGNVEFREGAAESLPLENASMDVALINGIFNLNPRRTEIFEQLARVLRRGGEAFVAELILKAPTQPSAEYSDADWFS